MRKRSTYARLPERIARWLKGDFKKVIWKVAFELDV